MPGVAATAPVLAPWVLGLLVGLAVLCLAAWVGLVLRDDPAARRLKSLAPGHSPDTQGLLPRLRQDLLRLLGRLASPARPKQEWQESGLRRELTQAGHRSPGAMTIFLGLRVLAALALPGLALISPLPGLVRLSLLPLVLAGVAVVGYLLPGIVLSHQGSIRRDRIGRELPDVLDLLVISVEAGLGLDAAIKRVAQEVRLSAPILSGELHHVSLELKAGIQRAQALRNLANRCGVDEVGSLAAMLIQADRFGVSVGRSLRVHSDSVRTKRRQRMEELAAKIPLKLLFPVLFMIFPAIMAVMAGPALIRVSESIIK